MLCQKCENIPSSLFESVNGYDHSVTRADLVSTATGGCRLCSILLQYLDSYFIHRTEYVRIQFERQNPKIVLRNLEFAPGIKELYVGWDRQGDDDSDSSSGPSHRDAIEKWWITTRFFPKIDWCWARKSNEASLYSLERRTLTDDINSNANFQLIFAWLRSCLNNHKNCIEAETTSLPTRLINVGDENNEPFLVKTSELPSHTHDRRYLTLSHCWGSGPPNEAVITKTSTLKERLKSIPFSTMPKTFQDAITITRRLGERYIWIDSLCIIQDSVEDWQKESAMMARVYSSSFCTIAASSSSDGSGGCFIKRDFDKVGPSILSWRPQDNEKTKTFSVTIFPYLPSREEILNECHLAQRGWTLQEMKLSRRILHCTDIELIWQCKSLTATESMPKDYNLSSITSNEPSIEPYSEWRSIITAYSRRKLTKWSDRLPALSGLAHQMQTHLQGDTYLAGIWKSDILGSLLWYRASWIQPFERLAIYTAPSWSWASVKGDVNWIDYDDYDTDKDNGNEKERMALQGIESIAHELKPSVIEAQVSLAGLNPFGEVSSGYIKLSGNLKTVFTKEEILPEDAEDYYSQYKVPLFDHENGKKCGSFSPDCELEAGCKTLHCLFIARDEDSPIVLVLVRVSKREHEFARYGVGEMSNIEWFKGCERSIIRII